MLDCYRFTLNNSSTPLTPPDRYVHSTFQFPPQKILTTILTWTLTCYRMSTFATLCSTSVLYLCAGKWEWLSDTPSLQPPCDGAVSYYSQFGRVTGFTSAAGRRFRGILDQHLDLLLWPEGVKASICINENEDGWVESFCIVGQRV